MEVLELRLLCSRLGSPWLRDGSVRPVARNRAEWLGVSEIPREQSSSSNGLLRSRLVRPRSREGSVGGVQVDRKGEGYTGNGTMTDPRVDCLCRPVLVRDLFAIVHGLEVSYSRMARWLTFFTGVRQAG